MHSSTGSTTLASLSDVALVARVGMLAARERQATTDLVAALAEFDARKLYLGAACSSLFTYCTQVLHLSEHAAYGRIEAARCARKYPQILERLADGSLTLTTIGLLSPILNDADADAAAVIGLLAAAQHKSKRQVEQLVATVRPQPPAATIVRKWPSPRSEPPQDTLPADDAISATTLETAPQPIPVTRAQPTRSAQVRPLSVDTYKVQFTLSRAGHDALRRAQDLLRHVIPDGNPAAIFERALQLLVNQLAKKKLAATDRPRPAPAIAPASASTASRHIPAAVRREVWERDDGQCAFVGTHGRCQERGFLEFHHCVPFADGGATSVANLQLRCRAHNQHEAGLWLGIEKDRPPGYASD